MNQFILRENVLTDNVLLIADKGKVFKGNYIAILKEYKYQNAWNDKETILKFRSEKSLLKYLGKNYNDEELEQIILN
jgi:hypothetical protein